MKIIVTGAAGYIGSFMTGILLDRGYEVIALDNLKRGHLEAVDKRAKFIQGDLLDKDFLDNALGKEKIEAVIHFAGAILTNESMQKPSMYFENNLFGSLNLLEVMQKHNIDKFIFSSTAGVYGNVGQDLIKEDVEKNPENPYGASKLMVEKVLAWYNKIFGINFVVLRYFNASGAALDASNGERHDPETHIIPIAVKAAIKKENFYLFGQDYNTPDGTCIRDYIHVLDLANAHLLALEKLSKDNGGYIYNAGTGKGFSNKEVIAVVEKVSGHKLEIVKKDRRPGDADTLVADVTKIKKDLGFQPKYSDLETIVKTAYEWHKSQLKI